MKRERLDTTQLKQRGVEVINAKNWEDLEKRLGMILARTSVNYCDLDHARLIYCQTKVSSL
jgi:hypothetical protein